MATNTNPFYTYSATAGSSKTLQKPQDGGDNNQWGTYINTDLDEIVSAVNALSDKIADANEKTLVDFTATGSAVNHVGITNAATGNPPQISSAGSDTNVDLTLNAKGTGDINLTPGTNGDVNIPASKGITFGDDGEKIEGDGTDLTIASSGEININAGTLDLSAQTVDVTLNNVVDALNFDSNTLSINALNTRIGIGTAAPETLLHLESAQNAQLKLVNTDVGYSPQIILQGKTNAADNFLGQIIGNWDDKDSPVAKIVFESGVDTSNKDDGFISFWTATDSSTVNERMRIDQDGNVGIGVTSARVKTCIETQTDTDVESEILELNNTYSANQATDTRIRFFATNSNTDVNARKARIEVTDQGNTTGRDLSINTTGGNVGIGTTSPNGTLTCRNGSSNTSQLILGNTLNTGGRDWRLGRDNAATGDFIIYSSDATDNNNTTERMRIDQNGNVLIGSSTNVGTGDHKVSVDIGTTGRALGLGTSSTGAKILVSFVNGNGTVGDIRTSGTSTSYVTSSDYRLKENVSPITGAIDRINQLKPSRFNFIADPETTLDGFLAHEVSGHVPEAVTGQKDAMTTEEFVETEAVFDEEGNEITPAIMGTREVIDPQGIDQSKLVPLLVASVQELSAKVTALENA